MPNAPPVEAGADSIDAVIDRLTEVVDWAHEASSRLGYFAALYRDVTVAVGRGIRGGLFEDGERMERFDVIFANRYLQALVDVREGRSPGAAWGFAFESAEQYWPIVLQHLLLGMNAHINLDLGIAAAETMRGRALEELRADFDKINQLLASLVDDVQARLADVWLLLRLLNGLLGDVDNALIGFSMERARDEAWRAATRLWSLPDADWEAAIRTQDERHLPLARLIRYPGFVLGSATHMVRLGEVQDVGRVIDILVKRSS